MANTLLGAHRPHLLKRVASSEAANAASRRQHFQKTPSYRGRHVSHRRLLCRAGDAGGDAEELIRRVLKDDADDKNQLAFSELSFGYCNSVYLVHRSSLEPVVVKLYSDLSVLRTEPEQRGSIDKLAENAGLGPRVLSNSDVGIAHAYLKGRVLQEVDMHTRADVGVAAANLVSSFHSLPVPSSFDVDTPLLWKWLERMLDEIGASGHVDTLPDSVNFQILRKEVDRMATAVKGGHTAGGGIVELGVVLAHGDLKPTNIMLVNENPVEVLLIDLELSGPNYRGFDLMKLFRTNPETYSDYCFVAFLKEYCRAACLPDTTVRGLEAETKLFEPLTWLEAAIFFALLIVKGNDTPENVKLLTNRWERYQATKWMVDHYLIELRYLRETSS